MVSVIGFIPPGERCIASAPLRPVLEFRQQNNALLLVGIGTRDDRYAAFRITQIVRQMRHIGGDVKKVPGAGDEMVLEFLLADSWPSCLCALDRTAGGILSDVAGYTEQGTEGVERIEPPVEAECEFVEVGLQMLMADPVMDAVQPRFQVGEDEMDDWQILLGDLRIAPFSDGGVFVAALGEAGVG